MSLVVEQAVDDVYSGNTKALTARIKLAGKLFVSFLSGSLSSGPCLYFLSFGVRSVYS